MKNLMLIAFSLLLTIGCSKKDDAEPVDPCAGITCQNGGTCASGNCVCPTGYYGVHCEKVVKDSFLGIYNCHMVGEYRYPSPNFPFCKDTIIFDKTFTTTIIEKPGSANAPDSWIQIDTLMPFGGVTPIAKLTAPNAFPLTADLTMDGDCSGFVPCFNVKPIGTLSGNTITITFSDSCFNAASDKWIYNFTCTMVKQ